jgi:hypothetical protein
MQHGGATIYYKEDGTLYISGNPSNMRSRDNGVTWENIGPTGGYLSIIGDGNYLYSGPIYGPAAFSWAPEDDDNNWTMLDGGMTQFRQGPFEMAYSPDLGLLYASCNQGGVWAMKVPTP